MKKKRQQSQTQEIWLSKPERPNRNKAFAVMNITSTRTPSASSRRATLAVNVWAACLLCLVVNPSARAQVQVFQQIGNGAVIRTAQAKLADVVNVRDFGAQCNGV